jgi:phosphatidylglycerophosphatase A
MAEDQAPSRFKPRKPGPATPKDLGRVDRAVVWVATVGGLGRVPVVGGTLAALVAVPLWFVMSFLPLAAYGGILGLLLLLGVVCAGRFDRLHRTHDDTRIVIDELVGVLLLMLGGARTLGSIVAGLILFGVLDILKPPPLSLIDKHVRGGIGVMGDDLAAGLIGGVLLWVMRWVGLL